MTTGQLFDRIVTVTAGPPGGEGKTFSGLRIAFQCNHSGGRHPNRASVAIYNLPRADLGLFKPRQNIVSVSAGYGGLANQVFAGNPVRDGTSYTPQTSGDRILEVELADGGEGYTSAYISKTFSGTTAVSTVLDFIREQTGWDAGDIELPAGLKFDGSTTFTDKAPNILDRIAQFIPGGGTWFVRDNALYIKRVANPTAETALVISRANGNLIGTPTPTRKGVKVRALLDSTMRAGRRIQIDEPGDPANGFYYVTDAILTGDSGYTQDFYMDLTAKSLGVD